MNPSFSERILSRVGLGPVVRMDSAPVVVREDSASSMSGAGISNAISGLGGARDSGAMARPNTQRELLNPEELVALLRSSVYRRIVELHPQWATAKGWTITDSTKEEKPLAKAMQRLNLRHVIRKGDTWGRALGEARGLLVTDDPYDLSDPLVPSKVRKLHRIEIFDRREFSAVAFNGDAAVGPLGEPLAYRLHPTRPGVMTRHGNVHASRFIRFYGDELPPSEEGYGSAGSWGWGSDAIGQTLWDGIRDLAQTGAGGSRLAQELSIAVFKIASTGGTAGDQRAALLSRMTALNMMKSIAQAVWLAPGEEFSRVAATPAGFKDLSDHAKGHLALLTGIPLALLYGEAPSGLTTDASSWEKNWFSRIGFHRESRYRDPLEAIIEVLYYAEMGGVPDEWSLQFDSLGELGEKEKAEIRLIHTQADGAAVLDGILTPAEARTRYTQPGGFGFELQPVMDLARAVPIAVDPAVEAEARAAIEAGMKASPTAEPAVASTEQGGESPPTDLALNGAQVTSASIIIEKVIAQTIPSDLGAYQLEKFFGFTPDVAREMIRLAMTQPPPTGDARTDARRLDAVGIVRWGIETHRRGAARVDATDGACWIGLPLPESARAGWAAARAGVEAATGPLADPGDDPHVTALYLGQLAPEALPEVEAAVREVAAAFGAAEVCAETVTVFPHGKDGTPVVMGVRRAWTIEAIQAQLLARLAHLVTQKQHVPFRPHLTLGYGPVLTGEQQASAMEATMPELEWVAARLEVRHGSTVVAVVPLSGRVDTGGAR